VEDLDRVTVSIVAAELAQQTSEWARFPAGPLERHIRKGGPEGVERWGPLQTRKGSSYLSRWAKFEEASANY
jgi:hypothetical protein